MADLPDLFDLGYAERILAAYPSEVLFQWMIAYEYCYHSGVQPKGSADRTTIPQSGIAQSGNAYPDRVVHGSQIPIRSLGIRRWSFGPEEVDEVYGTPRPNTSFTSSVPEIWMGNLEYSDDDKETTSSDLGMTTKRTAKLTIPYVFLLVKGYKEPIKGDLVEFWGDSWKEFGVFYDVVSVKKDGYIAGSPHFVQYILELKRNDSFVPERRLLGCL